MTKAKRTDALDMLLLRLALSEAAGDRQINVDVRLLRFLVTLARGKQP